MEPQDMMLPIRNADHVAPDSSTRTSAEVVIAELAAKLLEVTREATSLKKVNGRMEYWIYKHKVCWERIYSVAEKSLMPKGNPAKAMKKILPVLKHNANLSDLF